MTAKLNLLFVFNLLVYICAGNQICNVDNDVTICKGGFPENENVLKLVLDIKRIEKDDLVKFTNLSILDLSNSQLEYIDPQSLISNEHLEQVNLSGVQGLQAPEGIFLSSKSLTHLNLSKTDLKGFARNAFAELMNLQILDLSGTEIKDFSFLIDKNKLNLIISEDSKINITNLCSEIKIKEITEKNTENETTISCLNNLKEETIEVTTIANISEQENHETIEETVTEIPITETSKPSVVSEISVTENSKPSEEIAENTKIPEITEIIEEIPENLQVLETPEEESTPAEIPENTEISETELTTETELQTTEISIKTDLEEETTEKETKKLEFSLDTQEFPVFPGIPETNTEKSQEMKVTEKENVNSVITAPEPQESKGTNIVLGIILVVMICGAVGFGYKYWKNRRGGYRNANTEDVEEGKELQNMVNRQNNEEQN